MLPFFTSDMTNGWPADRFLGPSVTNIYVRTEHLQHKILQNKQVVT